MELIKKLLDIQIQWQLDEAQMAKLCHVGVETYRHWMSHPVESTATVPPGMENAVPVIGIYRSLQRWFNQADQQLEWLTTPHKDFGQNRPIDIAASSVQNLNWVAYYLESFYAKPDHQPKS